MGFDPVLVELTLVLSPIGDLDADDSVNSDDIDLLASKIGGRSIRAWWLPDAAFDLNGDGHIESEDQRIWVHELKQTWFGDANLDGEFNSSDLINAFQGGKYEDSIEDNSTWSTGDWDADGDFTTGDLIVAFQDGGYEQGPLAGVAVVPEPGGVMLLLLGLSGFLGRCRERSSPR